MRNEPDDPALRFCWAAIDQWRAMVRLHLWAVEAAWGLGDHRHDSLPSASSLSDARWSSIEKVLTERPSPIASGHGGETACTHDAANVVRLKRALGEAVAGKATLKK